MAGFGKKEVGTLFTFFWPICVDNGLSVVAIDDDSGRLAGVFAAMDECSIPEKLTMC